MVAHGRMSQNVTEAGREFQIAAAVPFLQGLPETVRALKALGAYGARAGRGVPALPAPTGSADALEPGESHELLTAHGLTPPRSAFAPSSDDAVIETTWAHSMSGSSPAMGTR